MFGLAMLALALGQNTFTASPFAGFPEPVFEALLYNPPAAEARLHYPYKRDATITLLNPLLVLYGKGPLADGTYTLNYRIEAGETTLNRGTSEIKLFQGRFERVIRLKENYAKATRAWYEVEGTALRGAAALRWSRFRGQVKYLDGGWRSTYIQLRPEAFTSEAMFYVPVAADGRFDATVPARIYSVVNVNGAGYSYDAMERWGWDYDLTRDREDVFTIGRTELYGMHAFNVKGGARTVFVAFRPTALSRVLRFDEDGDGLVTGEERKAMGAAMTGSPVAIGPELNAEDVSVWFNGQPQKIVQFNRIPEYGGGTWQVQYLLQFYPDAPVVPGVWHEIKVRSKDTLRGKEVVDFGQGSVGFRRH
jgi:hypothetical protein